MRKDAAAWKRAFNAPQIVNSNDQPTWRVDQPHKDMRFYAHRWKVIENEKAAKRQRDLILYAAALGQKHGVLPADLSHYRVEHKPYVGTDGDSEIRFEIKGGATIAVPLRNLYWSPADPIEEAVLPPLPY